MLMEEILIVMRIIGFIGLCYVIGLIANQF